MCAIQKHLGLTLPDSLASWLAILGHMNWPGGASASRHKHKAKGEQLWGGHQPTHKPRIRRQPHEKLLPGQIVSRMWWFLTSVSSGFWFSQFYSRHHGAKILDLFALQREYDNRSLGKLLSVSSENVTPMFNAPIWLSSRCFGVPTGQAGCQLANLVTGRTRQSEDSSINCVFH